jgi:hypothetical protein
VIAEGAKTSGEVLDAFELGKIPLEGADGRMSAFPGNLENEHVGINLAHAVCA